MKTENVLVIPSELAENLCPVLFGPVPEGVESTIITNCSFREREESETNFSFKQVIPYIAVAHGTNFLISQRTKKQQEARLHNKYSLGQGGHINDIDFNDPQPLIAGIKREIKEEFTLSETIISCAPIGLVNDNSNEVGKVHLGIVYRMEVNSPRFKIGEEGHHIAQWATPAILACFYETMENWSKILFDHYIKPNTPATT